MPAFYLAAHKLARRAAGGTRGSVSTCGKGAGYLTASSDCVHGSVGAVCCLPLSACANAVEFDCCASTATFRPSCVGGQLVCAEGQARCGADAGP